MVDHFRLSKYELKDDKNGQIPILISGSIIYYNVLRRAFSNHRFSRAFPDYNRKYDWGTYIDIVGADTRTNLEDLLNLLKDVVCLEDALDQTFALDYHKKVDPDELVNTEIGNLVYKAKPYPSKNYQYDNGSAIQLADRFANFVARQPAYSQSNYLVSVPPSDPNKPFDLPTFLVAQLCERFHIKNGNEYVRKTRATRPMKDVQTVIEKTQNIRDAFKISDGAPFQGQLVTLIDDIYQSGTTLHELATELQRAGARVQGLVATKTLSNPN